MALQAGKRLATSPLLRLAAATAPRAAVAAAAAPSAAWHSDALVRVSSRSGRQVREVSSSSHRAAADKGKRPLSPHLTIYRFGQNALTSIGFRATGMVLTGGMWQPCARCAPLAARYTNNTTNLSYWWALWPLKRKFPSRLPVLLDAAGALPCPRRGAIAAEPHQKALDALKGMIGL